MRLISLLFAFVALCGCATPASGQTPTDAIASCLGNAAEPEQRRACIGAVAGPCMDEPGGETTVGMVICFARERDLWTAQVVALTARLRGQESPSQIEQLDAMLAAHEQWMRAKCQYSASVFEGGSLAQVVASACVRGTTADLALDLMARFDEG